MATVNKAEFNIKLSQKQFLAWNAPEPEILYGGSAGSGKSVFLVAKCFINACKYPGSRSFIGRKVLSHFTSTTLQTWYENIPASAYKENKQDKTFKIKVGDVYSTIFYGGLNSREELDKFKSAEYSFVYIDEASELEPDDFLQILSRLRQKLSNGTFPPYQAYFTSNPAQSELRNRFIMGPKAGVQRFIPALPGDNPYLDPTYVERMKELYKYRPEVFKCLMEGDWNIIQAANMIYRQPWVDACMRITDMRRFTNKCGVSLDAARFGDDETAIYGWNGSKQVEKNIFGKKDEMAVAAEALGMLRRINGNWIAVGGGAIGLTVIEKLKLICDNDIAIILVDEKAKAKNSSRYFNVRAEMYWEGGDLMAETAVSLIPDPDLSKQLLAQTYKITGGRILVDSKDIVKLKLNRSPDHSDGTVIGLWAMLHEAPDMPTMNEVRESPTQKAIRENALGQGRNAGSYQDNEETVYYEPQGGDNNE